MVLGFTGDKCKGEWNKGCEKAEGRKGTARKMEQRMGEGRG